MSPRTSAPSSVVSATPDQTGRPPHTAVGRPVAGIDSANLRRSLPVFANVSIFDPTGGPMSNGSVIAAVLGYNN
ncbi:MAG: hypothetical protein QOH03_4104, partial [Kribbellaceae bacterium]|nr:hypothetical protein [Kribbellaceae bacterium]